MTLTLRGGATHQDFIVRTSPGVGGVRVRRDAARSLTSVHIERFGLELKKTRTRNEQITRDLPNVAAEALEPLDERGVIRKGLHVRPGTILIGQVEDRVDLALSPEEKLLRAIFGEAAGDVRDTSVRCPPDVKGTVTEVTFESSNGATTVSVTVTDERPLRIGDVLEIDGTRSVVSAIVDEQDGELVWSGASGTSSVRKAESAESRMEARAIGPYSMVTQQPLGGKAQFGGQQVDATQLRALESGGAWFAAAEMLTVKCDDVTGRVRLYEGIVKGQVGVEFGTPESASVLLRELQALGFAIDEEHEGES